MASHHSLNISIANKLKCAELALLVYHFTYWVEFNARAKKNIHEGSAWSYQTLESLVNHFPYWNIDKIHRMIKKLVKMGVLCKGNFNTNKYDRTTWYTFTDEFAEEFKIEKSISQNCKMEEAKLQNPKCENAKPIPDYNPDHETLSNKNLGPDEKKEATTRAKRSSQHHAFYFDHEKGKFEGIQDKDMENWKVAYPDINIHQEIVKSEQWLLSHPRNANKKNWRKYLVGWFGRAQEKNENRKAYQNANQKSRANVGGERSGEDEHPF